MKKHELLLGAHMSIAGGLHNALTAGESIDCTAIQLFTHSNRQWALKPLTAQEIERYLDCLKDSPIQIVIAHASYLLNIGSPNIATRTRSTQALIEELERCQHLKIPYLVLHPGAALTSSPEECMQHISDQINQVLEAVPGNSMILLENAAGQGSTVGSTFEQLAQIRKNIHHKTRIGICFDTCHAFVAGYNFSTRKSYTEMWDQFDTIIGLEHLKVIHLNDSKKGLNSHVDRHDHIGAGKIGLEAFKLIMNDIRFSKIPKILETPKDKNLEHDIENLTTLKNLLD